MQSEMDSGGVLRAWSKAGCGTTILWSSGGSKKRSSSVMVFDLGRLVSEEKSSSLLKAKFVFLSHGHLDHCSGVFLHARIRAMMNLGGTTCFVPKPWLDRFIAAKEAMGLLDGNEEPLEMEIVGVSPGDVLKVDDRVEVRVTESEHRVPSVGYLVHAFSEQQKESFSKLSPEEKQTLFQNGARKEDHYEIVESIPFGYTGDATGSSIFDNEAFRDCATLCLELTFLDGEMSLAKERAHVHIDELRDAILQGKLDGVREIVLVHFSARYNLKQILELLREKISASAHYKIRPMLEAFGVLDSLKGSILQSGKKFGNQDLARYASAVEWNAHLNLSCDPKDVFKIFPELPEDMKELVVIRTKRKQEEINTS